MRGGLFILAGLAALGIGATLSRVLGRDVDRAEETATPEPVVYRQLAELEQSHGQLKAELAALRETAADLDRQLGQSRQEATARSLEARGAQADAALARQEAERLRSDLLAAEESIVRLKRELMEQEVAVARSALIEGPAPPAAIAAEPGHAEESFSDEKTCLLLSRSADGSVIGISYGRKSGAEEGQVLELSRGGLPLVNVVLTQVRSDFSVGLLLMEPQAAVVLHRGEVLQYTLGETR